jgi:hypothetical protein
MWAVILFTKGFKMHAIPILEYLKKHGQKVDYEIAAAMDIPLPEIRSSLSDLSSRGEISRCSVTRFANGEPVEGMLCRIAGTIPPKAPGRKPGEKG